MLDASDDDVACPCFIERYRSVYLISSSEAETRRSYRGRRRRFRRAAYLATVRLYRLRRRRAVAARLLLAFLISVS